MKNTITVFKHEFITLITRRSFLITLFLLPLVSMGVFFFVSYVNRDQGQSPVENFFAPEPEATIDGYVDRSGLIETLPQGLEGALLPYASEAEAAEAMQAGEIDGYFIISADYLETGDVLYMQSEYNPFAGLENSDVLEFAIHYNLLGQDLALVNRVVNPYTVEREMLNGQAERDPDSMLTFFLPYIVTFLFYFVIFGSASLMLNSVTSEKQNRVLEILMTSITPMEMLAGKMAALGLVGLLQTLVWSGTGLIILRLSGRTLALPAAFQLDISILVWGLLFFLLGYAVYASLMAGVGALVPNLKEASQATFVIMIPLIAPLMLVSALISRPNSLLSILLSLFPLTSPVTMMTRLSATNVPVWQVLLALVLLLLTAYFVARAVAGLFRAQTLLTGQKFSLKLFFQALIGKA